MDAAHGGSSSSLSTSTWDGEEPWILEHPRFRQMMSLDVADSVQVYAAFLVYMDLLEVRNWHDVQILGSTELQVIYLRGQEKQDLSPQVIIPTPVSIPYSHERIQQFMKLDCMSAEDQSTSASNILLAIVESDSTVVYYKLTDGFVIPDPPDFEDVVPNKRWKKKKIRLLR